MIGITKSATPPAVLTGRGATETQAFRIAFDSGEREFTFKTTIYAHPDVKRQLIEDQHSKCCFCESKVGADGDVEHYRPKSGWRQMPGDILTRPGYYWLAYDWDNLLLCCSACNQRFKGNLFPLLDPAKRATNQADDIALEEPLFLNPTTCDPEEFIGFRQEIPYAIDGNPSAAATIASLGLAREILNERRRDRLALMIRLAESALLLERKKPFDAAAQEEVKKIRRLLAQAITKQAEFASMIRSALS